MANVHARLLTKNVYVRPHVLVKNPAVAKKVNIFKLVRAVLSYL